MSDILTQPTVRHSTLQFLLLRVGVHIWAHMGPLIALYVVRILSFFLPTCRSRKSVQDVVPDGDLFLQLGGGVEEGEHRVQCDAENGGVLDGQVGCPRF